MFCEIARNLESDRLETIEALECDLGLTNRDAGLLQHCPPERFNTA